MGRAKGEGTYETRKSDQLIRYVREQNGQRIVGPFRNNKQFAKKAWEDKQKKLRAKAEEKAKAKVAADAITSRTVGAEYYWCLFGVYDASVKPATKGVWADELAKTTYQLYKDVFKAHIREDPIAQIPVDKVDAGDLALFRMRLRDKRRTYIRHVNVEVPGQRQKIRVPQEVERKPMNARTVERYTDGVIRLLKRHGNKCGDELENLKLSPTKKAWLRRSEREAYLKLLPSDEVRLAAELMMHGMCIGEVCHTERQDYWDGHIRIESQVSMINGVPVDRDELKRDRRYRTIPIKAALARRIEAMPEGRLIGVAPDTLRSIITRATKGTKFKDVGPHDLRRSGGKWMLDAGAKLSDVAAILGNDPKTLLVWYDLADEEGKARAVQAV